MNALEQYAALICAAGILIGCTIIYLTPTPGYFQKKIQAGHWLAVTVWLVNAWAVVHIIHQPNQRIPWTVLVTLAICQELVGRKLVATKTRLTKALEENAIAVIDLDVAKETRIWIQPNATEWPPVQLKISIEHRVLKPSGIPPSYAKQISVKIENLLADPEKQPILAEARRQLVKIGVTHPIDIDGRCNPALSRLVDAILQT